MSLRSASFLAGSLLALTACHGGSSGSSASPPQVLNLGLAASAFFGAGDAWIVTVLETQQGRDLDGDGDLVDEVVFRLDLATGDVQNTGLVIGRALTRGEVAPSYLAAFGATFALGVPELEVGGLDRNDDGDTHDTVLALLDPRSGTITNLGLATGRIAHAGDVVAFDVPELAQGEDLDGDGVVGTFALVPHLHDLRTGMTRNTGLSGARVLNADGTFVAMAEKESVVGDRNGDGDVFDLVLAFYDPATDVLTSASLALTSFRGIPAHPLPHGGAWTVYVDEVGQGLGDLDGDGDVSGGALFAFDPRSGRARSLLDLDVLPVPEVAPIVLKESIGGGDFVPWFYDAGVEDLVSTGRSCEAGQGLRDELILSVLEEHEGQDLDGNGVLDGSVPAVVDPASGLARNLAIHGFPIAAGERVLVLSEEDHARNDWNGDGDRGDVVLHVWHEPTSQLVNTRIATLDATWCAGSAMLFLRSEDEARADLNGDRDRDDRVSHVYDAATRRVTNLALASDFLLVIASGGSRGFLLVNEAAQGADLNGDGDELDRVLHLVAP